MKKSKVKKASYQKGTGEILTETRVKTSVEWKIRDIFSLEPNAHHRFESPVFQFLDALWRLEVNANEESVFHPLGCTGMYLKKVYSATKEHNITWEMGILDKGFYKYESANFRNKFIGNRSSSGTSKLATRSSLLQNECTLFPHRSMTIFCNLEARTKEYQDAAFTKIQLEDASAETLKEAIEKTGTEVDSEEVTLLNSSGTEKLAQDMKSLLFQQKDCDTIIKIKGKEFRAHRLILGARSTVFSSMYIHDTIESRTGQVEIEDCDPEVFQNFLHFLYSGKLENISSENVAGLYVVADKYDVQEVKAECIILMTSNLSVDSICDIIALAIRYKELELLRLATDFFVKNVRKIATTAEWLSFHKEHPVESNELYIKAIEYREKD